MISEENGKIILYIRSDQVEIQYYDVAKYIASLVLDQPSDDTIFGIQIKLSTPLEELKRIGYPVKQLLKSLQDNDDGESIDP